MKRLSEPLPALLAAAIALCAWGACTQDFGQFEPGAGFASGSTTTGAAGGSTSTASGGGNGGSGASTGNGGAGGQGGGSMPACGNGVQDPGEQCDDGNTTSGDGCSASCTIEDPDSCPGPTLTLTTAGLTIMGDTSGANNDAGQQPCGGSNSGEFVYQITPAQSGTMVATMTGQFNTLLYARTSCPGTGSGTTCSSSTGPSTLTMQVNVGESFFLFADGYGNSAEEGPFTLTIDLN